MLRRLLPAILCCFTLHAESVVVLPFFNLAKQPNLEWIGESIAEAVHDSLASEGALVLDRDERLEAYRRLSLRPGAELTHASVFKIGESLDATHVVYGSFDLSAGSLRITARILDLKNTRQSQPFSQSGALEDLAAIETRLGWQALSGLGWKPLPSERDFSRHAPECGSMRWKATSADCSQAMPSSVIDSSPRRRVSTKNTRSRASSLAKSIGRRRTTSWPPDGSSASAPSDPHYLEAQFFLGLCRYFTSDFVGAEKSFEQVSAAMPLNEVFNDLGAAQDRRNNLAAAIASFQKAIEGDDRDPDYHFNLGYVLWRSGKYPAAVDSLRAVPRAESRGHRSNHPAGAGAETGTAAPRRSKSRGAAAIEDEL
jgi:TolB-like protein